MQLVKCDICGSEHDIESMQIGFARADAVLAIPVEDRDKRCWGNEFDCVQIDADQWFIRGWLPVPVVGRDTPFAWGIWVAIGRDDFRNYLRMYKEDGRGVPPFAGRIANHIAMFDSTLGVEVSVQMNLASARPTLTVADDRHPLARDQRNGITVERLLEILHSYR